ncbi:class I SAM-dependent methyltransferase [Thermodesulfobacteriota bacterium]
MKTPSVNNIHAREKSFHDKWAQDALVEDLLVNESFQAITAPENRFILGKMGDLKNKRLLDIGTGLGESAVFFALQGAKVTAIDISASMIDCALRLAAHFGVEIEAIASHAEALVVKSNRYDCVYMANVIHHTTDKQRLFHEVYRVLKPGGSFFAWDPLAYNPIINIYRRMATRMRTTDERPLTYRDIEIIKKYFPALAHREFWITSLALFLKYYIVNRIHPNDQRYWKRILKEDRDSLWWWLPLYYLDGVLTRLPGIRFLAWNIVLWGYKTDEQNF